MRVAFDASTVSGYSGIQTYTRKLIGTMIRSFPEDRIVLLSTFSAKRERRLLDLFGRAPNVEVRRAVLHPRALGNSLRRLTLLLRGLQLGIAARGADVLHLTQPYRERVAARNIVITAHDLFPLVLGDYRREAVLGEFRRNSCRMLRGAVGVIVYTRYVRDQIESVFPGVVRRFRIIPAAADESFRPAAGEPFLHLPEGSRPPAGYFVYVGAAYPRKNLPAVLRAHHDLPAETRRRHHLVLVVTGAKLHRDDFLAGNAELVADPSVHVLEQVTDEELIRIYGAAAALVYPSLGEGFGLPVLEAMRCGCPVITSSTTCLPEVAGEAALLVDPEDRTAIAAAMGRILSEGDLAARLRTLGLGHSAGFTWERTAAMTMDFYRECAAPGLSRHPS